MIQPGRYDIGADRWVACVRTLAFVGLDFTGATFAMQVRLYADAPGTALVTLVTVTTAAAEGVRLIDAVTDTAANHIAAGRLDAVPPGFSSSSNIVVSRVGMRINETTMNALPSPSEVGSNTKLAWDLVITPAGGLKDKYIGGDFTVRSGVTR